jgi:hypothetical protein
MATNPIHPVQRKKPAKRAFTGLAGSPLAVTTQNDLPTPKPKRGRPPLGGAPMSAADRKRKSRQEQDNRSEINKLAAEQKIDNQTGGRGKGFFMRESERGTGVLISGWRDVNFENDVLLGSESAQLDLETFGGRKTSVTVNPDDIKGKPESAEQFHRPHPHNWRFDHRDKEEIARSQAKYFIEVFDPKRYLKFDPMSREFVPWECAMCTVCRRTFAFARFAEEHIVEVCGSQLIKAPRNMSWVVSPAQKSFNLDVTRHKRVVLRGLEAMQPRRTKRQKAPSRIS